MKRVAYHLPIALLIATILRSDAADQSERFVYPKTQKSSQADNYFGTEVADPYRGLENADSTATKKWIAAENELTFRYLAAIPERKRIVARKIQNRLCRFPESGYFTGHRSRAVSKTVKEKVRLSARLPVRLVCACHAGHNWKSSRAYGYPRFLLLSLVTSFSQHSAHRDRIALH